MIELLYDLCIYIFLFPYYCILLNIHCCSINTCFTILKSLNEGLLKPKHFNIDFPW